MRQAFQRENELFITILFLCVCVCVCVMLEENDKLFGRHSGSNVNILSISWAE